MRVHHTRDRVCCDTKDMVDRMVDYHTAISLPSRELGLSVSDQHAADSSTLAVRTLTLYHSSIVSRRHNVNRSHVSFQWFSQFDIKHVRLRTNLLGSNKD